MPVTLVDEQELHEVRGKPFDCVYLVERTRFDPRCIYTCTPEAASGARLHLVVQVDRCTSATEQQVMRSLGIGV